MTFESRAFFKKDFLGLEARLTKAVTVAVSAIKDRDMDRKKVLLRNKSPSLSLLMKHIN